MDAPKSNPEKYIVPAVEQAASLLFCLSKRKENHMSLNEICDEIGIHKSKAYSILLTLQRFGLIQKNSGKSGYSLGPGLISLSRKVLDDLQITNVAAPLLEELAKKTEATATLGLIVDNKVFVVSKFEGVIDVGITVRVGQQFDMTLGSHGKAIAAFLPKQELDDFLKSKELYFHGTPEKFDMKRLFKEIEQCRRDGFALDLGEVTLGLNTAAAPVLGVGETPIGYIAVLGLFSIQETKDFGPIVAQVGRELSRRMGAAMI